MNNKEAIEVLKILPKFIDWSITSQGESIEHALDYAIKALEIVDIPHTKDYTIFQGQKLYLTQGHIDALLEYERKQIRKEVIESFTKPFNVDLPKDFYGRCDNDNR